MIKELENELSNLDLVSTFFIEKFTNKITTYKIIYNSTQTQLNTIFNKYGSALESIAKIKSINDFKGDRSEGDIQIIHEKETFYLKLLNIIDFKGTPLSLKLNLVFSFGI